MKLSAALVILPLVAASEIIVPRQDSNSQNGAQSVGSKIGSGAEGAWNTAASGVKEGADKFTSGGAGAWNTATSGGAMAWNTATSGAASVFGDVTSGVKNGWDKATSAIGGGNSAAVAIGPSSPLTIGAAVAGVAIGMAAVFF